MDLDLLPPAGRQLEEVAHRTGHVAGAAEPDFGGQPPPERFHRVSRVAHIDDHVGGAPSRAGLDLRRVAVETAVVLVHQLPSACRLGSVDVTVGIACEVGQHVSDRPSGETARPVDVIVVERCDGLQAAPVRVLDPPEIRLGDEHADNLSAAHTARVPEAGSADSVGGATVPGSVHRVFNIP